IPSDPAAGAPPNAPVPAASLDPKAKYLVVPFAQPGLADPHATDIMHSFMGKLQARNVDAKAAPSMDRLTAVANAKSLCATNGTSAIIVPWLRIEQSSFHGDSYAELRLDVITCGGAFVTNALGTADFKRGSIENFGSTAVAVSEEAMNAALDKLFPQ
ncbi:MAG TPA: hypothetical protein VK760_00305, partial [Candidatus Acidoferrales bacterium]|nr:hypothetical protein [Candidatus Acidoferrales bacterium]